MISGEATIKQIAMISGEAKKLILRQVSLNFPLKLM